MMTILFSTMNLGTWNSPVLLSVGILFGVLVTVALSPQRWLLGYVLSGMIYWLTVEMIESALTSWLVLSEWQSYVVAMGISWLPLGAWVLYRALRYDDVSQTMRQQRKLAAARYVEHSPVYDDDYRPRFQ